jgi:hypothetical protein
MDLIEIYLLKRTGTKFALNTIETETETHVNHPVISPTGSAMKDRTPLKEGEYKRNLERENENHLVSLTVNGVGVGWVAICVTF